MKTSFFQPGRRDFLAAAAAAIGSAAYLRTLVAAADDRASESALQSIHFCAFEKFLQDLSHDELADGLARARAMLRPPSRQSA